MVERAVMASCTDGGGQREVGSDGEINDNREGGRKGPSRVRRTTLFRRRVDGHESNVVPTARMLTTLARIAATAVDITRGIGEWNEPVHTPEPFLPTKP